MDRREPREGGLDKDAILNSASIREAILKEE
jgi:hypothetical protein